jgi:hypothetical protein
MEKIFSDRLEKFVPSILFLLAFGFSLAGLNPTFYADDSPETVAACAMFGIPHPPGYPLHTLVGHLFSKLSAGALPYRVNLFSAFLSAGICGLLFLFLRRVLTVDLPLAAAFGLLWSVGAAVYPASLSAKTGIYLLTALFLIGILWALFEERVTLAVFLFGLSCANHWMTMAALFPGFALLAYFQWRKNEVTAVEAPALEEIPAAEPRLPDMAEKPGIMEGDPLPSPAGRIEAPPIPLSPAHPLRSRFLVLPALLVLGLSVYLILPIRAKWGPLLNWGEPSNWGNFQFNFLRSQYGSVTGDPTAVNSLTQWVYYLKSAFMEFPGLLLAALWGLYVVWRRDRDRALGAAAAWGSLAVAVCLYLGLPKEQLFLLDDYGLASHVFILLFSAWGLAVFLSGREGRRRKILERIALAVLLIFILSLAVQRYSKSRQTGYTSTHDFVLNAFKGLPQGALFLCKGDSVVFPCWYFQWVEGKRPDIVVIGVDGFPMEWVRKGLARAYPGMPVPFTPKPVGVEALPSLLQWLVDRNKDRPLYLSYNKIEDGILPGTKMIPYGVAGEAFPPGRAGVLDEARADRVWKGMRLRHLQDPRFPLDERTRLHLVADYAVFRNALGVVYEDRGDAAKAGLSSKTTDRDVQAIQYNYQKSYEHFFWASQWMPGDANYACNTGNALFHLGRLVDSMKWYDKAVKLKDDHVLAHFNYGVAALQAGSYLKAGQLFDKVLELKPDYLEAMQGLDYLKKSGFYQGK